jgi:type I restriction enzyme, S subunit
MPWPGKRLVYCGGLRLERKLPEEWKYHTIEDVCTKVTDGSHYTPKFVDDGYPFVMISDIKLDGIDFKRTNKITEADYNKLKNNCNPIRGDVLFTKDGTVGKVLEITFDKEYIVLSSIAILRPNQGIVLSKFLRHILNNKHFLEQALQIKTGTGLTRLILKNLRKLMIPIPPLETQRKIVAILDKAEEIKRLRARSNELTKKLLQSVFLEMFGDPSTNNFNWSFKKIKNICNLINGKAFKPSDWKETGLPIIRIQNLNNNNSKFNYFDGEIEKKYIVEKGDLLFAWSGTPNTSFGAHIWLNGKAVLNQHIFRILLNDKLYNKIFFKFCINYSIIDYINQAHGSSGLAHITKDKLENTDIIQPPIELQDQFARIVNKIEINQQNQLKSQIEINILFEILLMEAFSGEQVV